MGLGERTLGTCRFYTDRQPTALIGLIWRINHANNSKLFLFQGIAEGRSGGTETGRKYASRSCASRLLARKTLEGIVTRRTEGMVKLNV